MMQLDASMFTSVTTAGVRYKLFAYSQVAQTYSSAFYGLVALALFRPLICLQAAFVCGVRLYSCTQASSAFLALLAAKILLSH